ncbi:MAG: small basic family protein [Ignavibacteriales bacterium]
MYLALAGLILGVVLGVFLPYNIPVAYSNYMAVAILACLDSVFGGYAASLQGKFDMKIFISGFFGNALLAAALAFIGDKLGADIYMAAVFAFGNRMFINFAIIRRYLLNK